jgi:hypothetical protein
MPEISDEYARRLSAREARVSALDRTNSRVGAARLLVALITIVAGWYSLREHAFHAVWICVPIAVFVGLVLYHGSVLRARSRAARASSFYRKGLARMEDRWPGTGHQGERFDDPRHVYAADLDLFGKGSLFELLCAARTRMGEDKLAGWLLAPATVAVIKQRHAAIAELKDRLDLREAVAVLGENLHAGVHPEALLEWAETPNLLQQPWIRSACAILPLLAVAGGIFWALSGIGWPFLLALLLEAAALFALGSRVNSVLNGTENAFEDLRLFAALLTLIERERVQSPTLQALLARLSSHSLPASQTIGRLATVVSLAGSRRNQIMALLSVPLMYTANVALAAERWRRLHGAVVRAWVEVLGEFEAHLSLASYSCEHPDDSVPSFEDGAARLQGTSLGHPLIPAARRVRNDVSVCHETRVLLISGSNMSGKSTLLRTVGINVVLAMAGAPVCAGQFRISPLQVGASIRINDSLHEGSSRFYAEITRLRQLFDVAGRDTPLLFLLDELLQGTNSADRRIGAEGIVRAFVASGAIGLISTHDLALTALSGLQQHALHNMHFQDELLNGRMKFDFKLREGVVTRSNAVELMRSIGLDV